jgi:hypothetical protein
VRFIAQAFFKCGSQARLANARLAGEQNDLAFAVVGARPTTQQ